MVRPFRCFRASPRVARRRKHFDVVNDVDDENTKVLGTLDYGTD